ncbi:hypothetical protein [Leifsonia virtsii]|uniref:Uncharacterized protein n=1 Tax=Leifsonia virtsii TaxID=3035915 RepID=A0ABT8IXS8_9MICO|nr:hypothetical protein [Leifsonia virtsii]MDN4597634.1 hypothetical protein [Leifsonia virtsii]
MMRSTREIGTELCDGMHHLSVTVTGRPIPAHELCNILANLEAAGGYNFGEVLSRLAGGFERSLREDETTPTSVRERLIACLVRSAAERAQQIALCLEAARYELEALAPSDVDDSSHIR